MTTAHIKLDGELLTYYEYLTTWEWTFKAKKRKNMDGNKCTLCGDRKRLAVHHLTYKNVGAEKLQELRTLCRTCHEDVHTDVTHKFNPRNN